jgi:hypothetical protein
LEWQTKLEKLQEIHNAKYCFFMDQYSNEELEAFLEAKGVHKGG